VKIIKGLLLEEEFGEREIEEMIDKMWEWL
jgi:hypothetical protein